MQKSLLKIISITIIATILVGCSSKQTPEELHEADFRCKQDGELAPKWTCNPYLEGSIVALGVAPKNAGNDYGMQRTEAIAEGRNALTSQISVKVNTLLKSYKGTTGTGSESTFDKTTSIVSKQLASQTLQGSRGIKSWQSKKGTLYILVGLNTNIITQGMDESVQTSYKNDKAMYQKFLSAQAHGELDAELEKAAQ